MTQCSLEPSKLLHMNAAQYQGQQNVDKARLSIQQPQCFIPAVDLLLHLLDRHTNAMLQPSKAHPHGFNTGVLISRM